jgi:hypothetical protein
VKLQHLRTSLEDNLTVNTDCQPVLQLYREDTPTDLEDDQPSQPELAMHDQDDIEVDV